MEIIQTAIDKGIPALSEHQSKKILEAFGIPTTRETLVQGCKEAVAAAEAMGYPVVLKACAAHLMHKSEKNCIRLNLTGPDPVREAYDSIMDTIDVEIDGILVQETIHGQRELIMGMTRDPSLGPASCWEWVASQPKSSRIPCSGSPHLTVGKRLT